jgi:tetratricopeptide (TPR) repeat protein
MSKITDNPYPGSRAFQQADQDHFYGRTEAAQKIAGLWAANRLTVVAGPAGSGKSSLLLAGVYPLMPDLGGTTLPVGLLSHGMTFPFGALPENNPYTLALLRSWAPDEVPTRLAGLTVTDYVRRLTRRHDGKIFAAIDQADDLAIDPPSGSRRAWRRQFLTELSAAYQDNSRLHLLLVARAEALPTISASIGVGARYDVEPLTIAEAIEAVTEPASRAGRRFDDGAARKLIEDLSTSRITAAHGQRYVTATRVEPALLQAVCQRLWDEMQHDVGVISEWAVRESGDADTALALYCAEVITRVAAMHSLKSQRLQSWLLATFITDSGARGTAYETMRDGQVTAAGMPATVARSLVDCHLLSSELKHSSRYYCLLSDRLMEPLRHAIIGRCAALTAADYLRAAERDLVLGEVNLAMRRAENALRAAPSLRKHAEAESLLGNVAVEQEQPAEAVRHYREAASLLEMAGDTGAAARTLAAAGQALLAQGDTFAAVRELRIAVERARNDLILQTELALALWQFGEGRAAVAVLNSVLGVDGGHLEALRARGEILADLGDARGAMLDLNRQSVRDHPSTQAARGLALAELGDHSAATQEINDALTRAPQNGPVLLYAARASALSGDQLSSEEHARRAIDATDPPLSQPHREYASKLATHG